MDGVNGLDADSLPAGTEVEVETASGSYRGTLTRPYSRGSDVELRCAAHYVRVHRRSIHRGARGEPHHTHR